MSSFDFDKNTSPEFHREFIRDNIVELCEHFFPKGKKVGTSWYIGSIAGEEGDSLEIALEPREKAGLWLDRATDEEKGDFITLIQQNFKEVSGRELSFAETLKRIFEAKPAMFGNTTTHKKTRGKIKADPWWQYMHGSMRAYPRNREKLAKERGYSPTAIEKIVEAELIGVYGINDDWAFPIHHEGVVVATHKKVGSKWVVEPNGLGIGIPPLVYGTLTEAEEIHIFESQWDMFALADLLGAIPAQQRITFAATRGAKNGKAIEEILSQLGGTQRIYPWPQHDLADENGIKAGELWLDKVLGIASELDLSITPCWIPDLHPDKNFDLNDWLREGATRAQAEEIIRRAETIGPRGKHLEDESIRRIEWYHTEYEKIPGGMRPEAFYGLAGEITRICVEHSECSPEAILLQFLILFGNLIGRYAHASGGSKKLFTNEYGIILGPTASARKGTALDLARGLLKLIDPYWSKFCIKSGLASGEGLIHHLRDMRMNNCGSRVVDSGVADKRFQALEEEFARTVTTSQRNGNTLPTVLRLAWDKPRQPGYPDQE